MRLNRTRSGTFPAPVALPVETACDIIIVLTASPGGVAPLRVIGQHGVAAGPTAAFPASAFQRATVACWNTGAGVYPSHAKPARAALVWLAVEGICCIFYIYYITYFFHLETDVVKKAIRSNDQHNFRCIL